MIVVVPFAGHLSLETLEALEKVPHELVDVGGDDQAYGRLLVDLWGEGRTFLVWEHDIIGNRATVNELEACPHEWCSSPYPYFGQTEVDRPGGGLGFTKFSARLMARWPGAMLRTQRLPCVGHPVGHWCTRDLAVWTVLRAGGLYAEEYPAARHETHTPVGHRIGPPSHGCKTKP